MKIKVLLLLEFEQKFAAERFLPSAASVKNNPGPLFESTHFYSLSDFLSLLVLLSAGISQRC